MKEPFITTATLAFFFFLIVTAVGFIWEVWGTSPIWLWKIDLTLLILIPVSGLFHQIFEEK